jgi:hypothetical protein
MIIQVTKDDIKNGKRLNDCQCPIALAFKRNGFESVKVTRHFVELEGFDFELPFEAENFVKDFDNKKNVEPFQFKVEGLSICN